MKNSTTIIACAASFIVAASAITPAFAKDTITQKEFLKVKAKYKDAKKAVRKAEPKNKTTKFKEDVYDTALREVAKSKADMEKVNKDPKSDKTDKSVAKMNYEDKVDIAEANEPGKDGDHVYRNALKVLRIREMLYDEALKKKRIYPKDFTDLTEPEETIISMGETGDSTGIFSFLGRNRVRVAGDLARRNTIAVTRGGAHKPCHF